MEPAATFRIMGRDELSRILEIDRQERIEVLYEQQGVRLVARHGQWDAPAWDADGDGEHSVAAKVREADEYVKAGGVAVGAFANERLAGIRTSCLICVHRSHSSPFSTSAHLSA